MSNRGKDSRGPSNRAVERLDVLHSSGQKAERS